MQGKWEGDPFSSPKGRPITLAIAIFLFPKEKPNNSTVCIFFERWRRKEIKRKTEVVEAIEG